MILESVHSIEVHVAFILLQSFNPWIQISIHSKQQLIAGIKFTKKALIKEYSVHEMKLIHLRTTTALISFHNA